MTAVFIKTLGCKVNSFDSTAIANQLLQQGYSLVDQPRDADVSIINSCSVTQSAEKEARYLARRYKRQRPDTQVVITGCYAQVDSDRLAELQDVDYIVPNQVKSDMVSLLDKYLRSDRSLKLPDSVTPVRDNRQSHFKSSATLFDQPRSNRSRAFLKIQDGCDGFCSYCLIPYARGASISVDPAAVATEVQRIATSGILEIVLTGIHLGDYGLDLQEPTSLAETLEHLISVTPSKLKFRLSSLEPGEMGEDLFSVLAEYSDRFCAHFHLPLQSGCDRVLQRMRRRYTTEEYAARVRRLREIFTNPSIGADVIPGFPGETPEDFEDTLAFIGQLNLSYLHVFPYSKRPNTAAAKMPDHLDHDVVRERSAVLRDLSKELSRRYAMQWVGREVSVLWQQDKDTQDRQKGLSEQYLKVLAPKGHLAKAGSRVRAKIAGFAEENVLLIHP